MLSYTFEINILSVFAVIISIIGSFFYIKFNDNRQDGMLRTIFKKIDILSDRVDVVSKRIVELDIYLGMYKKEKKED
jgi:hypothetical protein